MNQALHRWLPVNAMTRLMGRRQGLLVLMFALLHMAQVEGVTTSAGRILMLIHLALFLLWQPFVSAQSRIANRQVVWMALALVIGTVWLSWGLLSLWLILLAGIVGGRVFFYNRRSTKWFYLLALMYLIAMLLLYAVPHMVPNALEAESLLLPFVRYGVPVLLVIMVLLPESSETYSAREAIDLAYSVLVMLMLAVLALGSAALMLLMRIDYVQALLETVFGMAAMLLLASWLWNPVAGVSRLGAVASRYMLSVGLPFEQWLRSLSELAQQESDPALFLDAACKDMVGQLSWVSACAWSTASAAGGTGAAKGIETAFRHGDLTLTLVTQQALAPALVWHFNLVAQLVAHFYDEKKRDRQIREMAYMQAIHETGARVTHDVKNLLQSLNALLFVIDKAEDVSSAKSQALMRRQLPLIAQRLQQTLEKLRVPESGAGEMMPAESWWRDIASRYEGRGVFFKSQGDMSRPVPASLFTSAVENLLQNALDKRMMERGVAIEAMLDMRGVGPHLSVIDTGSPLPAARAADVGARPMASENGLGIGLYQLARVAALSKFVLELSTNRRGEVCFSLSPQAD